METIINIVVAIVACAAIISFILASVVGILGSLAVIFPLPHVYYGHWMVVENMLGRYIEEDDDFPAPPAHLEDEHCPPLPVHPLSNNRGSIDVKGMLVLGLVVAVASFIAFVIPTAWERIHELGLLGFCFGTIRLSYADSARIFGCCGMEVIDLSLEDMVDNAIQRAAKIEPSHDRFVRLMEEGMRWMSEDEVKEYF